jgi:hypothetical protein
MNILILGCSFGTPHYVDGGLPGFLKEEHTEFLLRKLGHNVYNCSLHGSSNLQTIEQADAFLNGCPLPYLPYKNYGNLSVTPTHIDLILWFHTQIHREYYFLFPLTGEMDWREPTVLRNYKVKSTDFYGMESEMAALIYSQIAKLQHTTNAKLAVIGGAGPVHGSITEYIQPEFLIENWIGDIVEYDTEPIYDTFMLKRIDHIIPIELKTQMVDGTLSALDLMKNSGYFFDGCHPGPIPHQKLVARLKDRFNL